MARFAVLASSHLRSPAHHLLPRRLACGVGLDADYFSSYRSASLSPVMRELLFGALLFQILSRSQTTPPKGRPNQRAVNATVMMLPIQLGHPQKAKSQIRLRSGPDIAIAAMNQAAIAGGIATAITTVLAIFQSLVIHQ